MVGTALRRGSLGEREGAFFGYVATVCVAALVFAAPHLAGLPGFTRQAPGTYWLLAVLAVLCDVIPAAPLPGPVFPSACFAFAALLSCGTGPALLAQGVAIAAAALRSRQRPWRAAFQCGRYALALIAAHTAQLVVAASGQGSSAATGTVHASGVLLPRGPLGVLSAVVAWLAVASLLGEAGARLRGGARLRVGSPTGWQAWPASGTDQVLSAGTLLVLGALLASASLASSGAVGTGVAGYGPGWLLLALPLIYVVRRMTRLSLDNERHLRQDPVTGLPTRRALALAVAARSGRRARFALLLVDLDRFRSVNDALGHDAGDRLLAAVARRLAAVTGSDDVLARLGGDEFAVLTYDDPRDRAAQVAEALSEPVPLDGLLLDVTGAIGVARYPDHGVDMATLLRHAEVAMYDAKARGASVALYAPEADQNSPDRLALLADLRRALAHPGGEEIAFYYQPQVDIDTGAVIGVEALLRWHHPVRGPVDPAELIRVAEHSTVMRLLTFRVIDDVVRQLGRWGAAGVGLRASINVSVRDLHTMEIVDRLAERLHEHGVGAEQVQLEITEGALMADPRRVLATLRRLAGLGVALSLDDFGTGYSSMQHLRRLPLAEVKIDRSFVLGMVGDPDDEAIVRSIIDLAGALGLRVVAEGVEDERTYRLLATSGCHAAQGWFHGRPMPADELVSWLSRYRPPRRLLPAWPPAVAT